ncbi:ATP-binding protein [Streptacidiphilus sp. PAMC 29251]
MTSNLPTSTTPCRDVELRLPADRAAPAAARDHTRHALADWSTPGPVTDAALLVVSELVTNAVLHGSRRGRTTPVTVELHLRPEHLAVAVTDGHHRDGAPAPRQARSQAEHGRGLAIVTALAIACGHTTGPGCTTAWAHLPLRV